MDRNTPEPGLAQRVDRLLLERGELDPVDVLIASGLLRQSDLSLRTQRTRIISSLLVPVDEAIELLEQAHAYAAEQGLIAVPRSPVGSRADGPLPHDGPARRLIELCGSTRRPPEVASRQTDLFHDSTQTIKLNELKAALAEHRVRDARTALQCWSALTPDTQAVTDYTRLLDALATSGVAPVERLTELEALGSLAWQCLGPRATEYLSPLWIELAAAMEGRAFEPAVPRMHPSYALAQAQQWEAVASSVQAESGWSRHAALVVRHAEARARLGEDAAARRLWAQLCWTHPEAAPAVLVDAPGDPVVARLWSHFVGAGAELAVEDFPAWLLLADPHQARLLPAELAPESGDGLAYARLHRVVTSGGDMAARAALHEERPDLLRLYLAARDFGRA